VCRLPSLKGTTLEAPSLGLALKCLRKNQRLTLRQLADLANISNSYISQVENNRRKPSADYLLRIAPHLDAPPLQLLELANLIRTQPPRCPTCNQRLPDQY
jgi:transcriptional regulator with XRE-family HTH domain